MFWEVIGVLVVLVVFVIGMVGLKRDKIWGEIIVLSILIPVVGLCSLIAVGFGFVMLGSLPPH